MPTSRIKNALYCILLPFFAPGCGKSPVSACSGHEIQYITGYSKLIKKHHVMGSAAYLSSDNLSACIFTSSVNPSHHAYPETFFRVASITKIATSILVMRLSELGYISLDAPVSSYFPVREMQFIPENISLLHLLSHTSGLVDPPDLEEKLETGIPFTRFLSSVHHFPSGQSFHYSNLGFGLIGCILESVINKPVGEIYKQYLFEPLHLNATLEGCLLPPDSIMPVTRILPWRKGNDLILTKLGSKPLLEPDPLRHYGHTAGSMYTDILSLVKLLHVLSDHNHQFLSDHSVSKMKHVYASYGSVSPTLSYGLGLLRIDDSYISDSCIYGHQGFAYGCADGAFWEEKTGRMLVFVNGGCSEARCGRLGYANRDFLHWAFRKELPSW